MDVKKFERLAGIVDKLAKTQKGEEVLEGLSQKLYKMAENYNPFIFLIAFFIGILLDLGDPIVPGSVMIDALIFPILKAFNGIIVWTQYKTIKKGLLRMIIIVAIVPIVDTILGMIPFIELVSPIETIMVLFTWRSAKKEHLKNKDQAQQLDEERATLVEKKHELAKDFKSKAEIPESKKSKEKEVTELNAFKQAQKQARDDLKKVALNN